MVSVIKLDNGRFAKPCPKCGEQQTYLRRNYAESSLKLGKLCKACSNKITENCHRGWYKGVRVSWYRRFKHGAETRGLLWSLSLDDLVDIYTAQDKKCALTGWSIEFEEQENLSQQRASIDRIDSKLGYTKENVQLVHKHVNMMKQSYDQEYFIQMCKAVADKVKW